MKRWALTVAAMAAVGAVSTAEAGVRFGVRMAARPVLRPLVAPVVVAPVVVRTPVLRIAVGETVVVKRGHGRLDVNVEPERAKVFLDGRYLGRGDTSRVVPAGTHTVKVVLGDSREAAETVHVDAGRLTRVRLELN